MVFESELALNLINASHEDLIHFITKYCHPVGYGDNPYFQQYGWLQNNICIGWYWKEESLKEATNEELYKLIAICSYNDFEYEKEKEANTIQEAISDNPAKAWTITEVVERTPKYILLKDENERLRGINYGEFKVEIEETNK